MKRLILAMTATMLLGGCSEVEFGSYLFKSATSDPATASAYPTTQIPGSVIQQGNFKVGKPYSIAGTTYRPAETYQYTETGIASWYGPGFHGKKTASGETYNKHELTAAHRTLQMPSLVRVTNLGNGRSVIVRVNDRGPFSKGRIIDVSQRAAELLGMVGPGTAKVQVDMLSEESKAIADAAKRGQNVRGTEVAMNTRGGSSLNARPQLTMSDAGMPESLPPQEQSMAQAAQQGNIKGHYTNGHFYPDAVATQVEVKPTDLYVQAGAFGVEENAQKLSVKLSSIAHAVVEPVSYSGRTLYKVKLGPLKNVREADSVLSRVLASGHSDAIITVR